MHRERSSQRGRSGRPQGRDTGPGGRGHGRGEDKRGLLKAQGGVRKPKVASVKNQIRSIERLLRKTLAPDVKATQEAKLAELRKVADAHAHSELERKLAVRYHKIKFFERRKVERRIRRTERTLRSLSDAGPGAQDQQAELNRQLSQLKEDLEYVRFFPKDQKYIALFAGNEDEEIQRKRQEMRERVKANIAAAKAAQIDLEEASGSEGEEGSGDMSDDDFFMKGDISDVDADDEWTDISPREDTPRERSGGSRHREALALDSVTEDGEEAKEQPSVSHARQPISQRGRGGPSRFGNQNPGRGCAAMKPPRGGRGDGMGGRIGQMHGSFGEAAVSIRRENANNMASGSGVSKKRLARPPPPQEVAPEAGEGEKKKRKKTRPKKKKKQ